jgi:hypothetical protein
MTTPPRPPAPAPRPVRPATALPDAITYVLLGAAALITDDGDTGTPGLLHAGAGCACAMHGLPASLAPVIYRRAAQCLARASGYQPLDTADPVIDRALDELPARAPGPAPDLRRPPRRHHRPLTTACPRTHTRKGDSHATPRQQHRPGRPRSTCHEPARQAARRARRFRAPGHHRPRYRRQQAPVIAVRHLHPAPRRPDAPGPGTPEEDHRPGGGSRQLRRLPRHFDVRGLPGLRPRDLPGLLRVPPGKRQRN